MAVVLQGRVAFDTSKLCQWDSGWPN